MDKSDQLDKSDKTDQLELSDKLDTLDKTDKLKYSTEIRLKALLWNTCYTLESIPLEYARKHFTGIFSMYTFEIENHSTGTAAHSSIQKDTAAQSSAQQRTAAVGVYLHSFSISFSNFFIVPLTLFKKKEKCIMNELGSRLGLILPSH